MVNLVLKNVEQWFESPHGKEKKKKKTDVLTNDLEKLLLMEKISNYFKYKKKKFTVYQQ